MSLERRLRVLEEAAEIAATVLDEGCEHQWWRIQWTPPEMGPEPEMAASWRTATVMDLPPCECGRPRAVVELDYTAGGPDPVRRVLISSALTRQYLGA
jgi:hypothetical protein